MVRFRRRTNVKRNFRRRRTFRSRRFGAFKRKRSSAYTQSHGAITSMSFRSKRSGIRRIRAALFRHTDFKPHYRSVQSTQAVGSTGTNVGSSVLSFLPAESNSVGVGFWTTTGGAQPIDSGTTIPTFSSDIILRGGKIGMVITALDADTKPLAVKLYLMFVKNGMSPPQNLSGITTAQFPYGSDPSSFPDFTTTSGKILKEWSASLDYQMKTLQVEHKVRARKIDQIPWLAGEGQFYWLISVVNNTDGTNESFSAVRYHNFSFSADAL